MLQTLTEDYESCWCIIETLIFLKHKMVITGILSPTIRILWTQVEGINKDVSNYM